MLTDGKEFSIKRANNANATAAALHNSNIPFGEKKVEDDGRIRVESLKNPVLVSMKLARQDPKFMHNREKPRDELVGPETCKVCVIF